jgi:hypothetical protein
MNVVLCRNFPAGETKVMTNQNPGQGNKVAGVRSPVSRNRSLVRAVNRVAVASRNPANSSKSPDAKADNRISVKYYSSVRSLSPGSAGGFFYWIAMRDERQSSCKRLSIDAGLPVNEGSRSSILGDRRRTHRCAFPSHLGQAMTGFQIS